MDWPRSTYLTILLNALVFMAGKLGDLEALTFLVVGCHWGKGLFIIRESNQWNSLAADLKLKDINSFKRGLLNVVYIRTSGLS